ncbi:MAG: DUF4350 domain-containing protein [Myxococcaceae bacterium]|nr:DUF4350 domain-containing protein [Myxococcaceae bacterium]
MKRAWLPYAALLALALAAGLASPETVPDSPVPSAQNPGPSGVKLLKRYLEESGREVRLVETAFELPAKGTVVLAAPTGHGLSAKEREALEAFVNGGGTLVYLQPRRSHAQVELDGWLKLERGPPLARDGVGDDLLGTSDDVTRLPGLGKLRVLADDTVMTTLDGAVPLTKGKSLWWVKLGAGEVFIGAGADLAQASRLELDDNAAFWASLPGPVVIDELHQAPKQKPDLSANLLAVLAQLTFCGLAFVLVFAPRLGPPRPTLVEKHRSTMEYVRSMGALVGQAHIEAELARLEVERVKRALDLTDDDVPVRADGVKTPADYLALSRRCAELERTRR